MLRAVILAVAGAACLLVAAEHFTHQYQPKARGESIPGYDHIAGPTLAEIPAAEFKRGPGEAPLAYVERMTRLVHLSTYHCAPTDHELSWVERAVETVMAATGRDPQRVHGLIDRSRLRCGFCSERAIALSDILTEHGVPSHAQGLNGHVVSLVRIDGTDYLADPDYGVGPYPYNSDEGAIRSIYLESSVPELAGLVVPIITNRADDYVYFTPEFRAGLDRLRAFLFGTSNAVAALFALAGVALIGAGVMGRSIRERSGRLSVRPI